MLTLRLRASEFLCQEYCQCDTLNSKSGDKMQIGQADLAVKTLLYNLWSLQATNRKPSIFASGISVVKFYFSVFNRGNQSGDGGPSWAGKRCVLSELPPLPLVMAPRQARGVEAHELAKFADNIEELESLGLPVGLGTLELGGDPARATYKLAGFLHRAGKV